MISNPDSPSAEAFRKSAKNIAAQCSIIASKLQEEMASESSSETSDKESAPEPTTTQT